MIWLCSWINHVFLIHRVIGVFVWCVFVFDSFSTIFSYFQVFLLFFVVGLLFFSLF